MTNEEAIKYSDEFKAEIKFLDGQYEIKISWPSLSEKSKHDGTQSRYGRGNSWEEAFADAEKKVLA